MCFALLLFFLSKVMKIICKSYSVVWVWYLICLVTVCHFPNKWISFLRDAALNISIKLRNNESLDIKRTTV